MIAPPRPPYDDPELLIKEARARQLRRRVLGAAGVAVAAAIGLSAYALLGTGGATGTTSPPRALTGVVTDCRAQQLSASAGLGGATMSELGSVTLTNTSGVPCALPLTVPRVMILLDGQPLTVRQEPWSESSAAESFPSQPIRVLRPGAKADIWLQWRNWCGRPSASASIRPIFALGFAHGLNLRAPTTGLSPSPPVCAAPGHASWLNVSPPVPTGLVKNANSS
jgi:hypothetical protein